MSTPAESPGREARAPRVSVVIATRDRAGSLRDTLRSLASVQVPAGLPAEVVVIDNGSTDDTRQVVADFAQEATLDVVYVFEPQPGKCARRTQGSSAPAARSSSSATTTSAFRPTGSKGCPARSWRDEPTRCRAGCAGRRRSSGRRTRRRSLASVITSTAHKTAEELETGLIGANMAISRRAYEQVGAFDDELGPGALGFGDETLLGWQLIGSGSRHLVALDVSVEHHFEVTRITRGWLLSSADRKGRSLGYIDFHWRHEDPERSRLQLAVLGAKDAVRTLVTPAAWPGRPAVPDWKYAYRSQRSRLRQLAGRGGRRERPKLRLPRDPQGSARLPRASPGARGGRHRRSERLEPARLGGSSGGIRLAAGRALAPVAQARTQALARIGNTGATEDAAMRAVQCGPADPGVSRQTRRLAVASPSNPPSDRGEERVLDALDRRSSCRRRGSRRGSAPVSVPAAECVGSIACRPGAGVGV